MENLVSDAGSYVVDFLSKNLSEHLCFHDLRHTLEVVFAAKEIAEHCDVSEEEMNIVGVAAWFHDCGYATGVYTGHEEESKKMAALYLENAGCDPAFIDNVLRCIDATKYPQRPKSVVEYIYAMQIFTILQGQIILTMKKPCAMNLNFLKT